MVHNNAIHIPRSILYAVYGFWCMDNIVHLCTVCYIGAKVNSTDSDRLTALHLASQEGCVDCVKLLLDQGADVTALSRHGDTPLSLAARYGQSISLYKAALHCTAL